MTRMMTGQQQRSRARGIREEVELLVEAEQFTGEGSYLITGIPRVYRESYRIQARERNLRPYRKYLYHNPSRTPNTQYIQYLLPENAFPKDPGRLRFAISAIK